jgi:hypothetical protein
MIMRKVELEPHEWGQVMQIISTAPWNVANSLLMKIGAQLREQELSPPSGFPTLPEFDRRVLRGAPADGKEPS